MRTIFITLITLGSLFSTCLWADIDSETGKINYITGTDVGKYLKSLDQDFDKKSFLAGLEDGLAERDMRLSKEDVQMIRSVINKKRLATEKVHQEKMKAEIEEQKTKNLEEGQAFMKDKALTKGIQSTKSGMLYEVLVQGDGPKPESATSTVVVHYQGTFLDGKKFDSSYDRGQPTTFALNQVIKGWTEGLQLMNTGSKFRFYIPPELAYGSDAKPLGPNQTLIFEVELIEIKQVEAK